MSALLLINITGPEKPDLATNIAPFLASYKVQMPGNPADLYALADFFVIHPENQVATIL